jgi:hypothetical protein
MGFSYEVRLRRGDPTVEALIRATFPSFAGQRVVATIQNSIRFSGTLWDDGCRSTYAMVRLRDLLVEPVPQQPYVLRSALHENNCPIPPGFACVVLRKGDRRT